VTAAELVEQAITEFGFDATAEQGLAWLNARHRKMVAKALWLRKAQDLGVTTAGQAVYATGANVVELHELTVDGQDYRRTRRLDMIAGRNSSLALEGYGGVFIVSGDDAGATEFELYPVPSTAGDAIQAFASVLPDELEAGDTPVVPPDFYDALVEGVIATGLSRDTEQLGAADRFEGRFDMETERLRRLARTRWKGTGPRQIRVVGINA
jgi:hypothetical protein